MIETAPRTKGEITRQRCLEGVRCLLATISRKLTCLARDKSTKTIVVEIISANGVLSAVESSTRRAVPHEDPCEPDAILGEIMDQLDSLTLPDTHKTIRIEIVSVNGTLSAIETESIRHRWDI